MSQLDIHLDTVHGIAQQLERAAARLSQTTQSLSALRTSLDGAIQSRRDIGRRLQAAYNHASYAERRTRQLASFLLEAVGRYGDAENGLARQARGLTGLPGIAAGGEANPKRPIDWASLWDNLGHYLLEYMNQLKEERYNIEGIDWSKVPPNMVDQIKASIDAAARQQAEASARADTLDDVLYVGGYTLEGPEHTRYYMDMNDNQLLVDSERMLELIDSYNRAFRTNLHTPDVALLMNMDVTEFLRYAMEQGYDPRTFQPLRDSDIREIEGYITARQQLSGEHHRKTRAWQSEAIGWIPGISAVKEAADVLAGKDVLTGEQLTKLDYGLAALSAFGPLGKGGKKVFKFAADKLTGKADEVIDGADNFINGLLKKSNCTTNDLQAYLKKMDDYNGTDHAGSYASSGKWPDGIQIPKSSDVLNADGSIKWSEVPNGGYVLDKSGNAIKEVFVPKRGDIIDRYGPPNGRYTSPVLDGKPYNYEQRSLPYVEDPTQYHQYKITGDFNNIETYVQQCSDSNVKLKVEAYMKKFKLSYDNLHVQKGIIAEGFDSPGGGIQFELPLPVNMLEDLGVLEKIK